MEKKIYVGNGKEKVFDNCGHILNISVKLDLLKEYVNDRGYVKLIVGKRREQDEYGYTHYVSIDTWKPRGDTSAPAPQPEKQDDSESLPF